MKFLNKKKMMKRNNNNNNSFGISRQNVFKLKKKFLYILGELYIFSFLITIYYCITFDNFMRF